MRRAAVFALALLASCGDGSASFETYALYRNLARAERIEVVTPANADDARLRPLAERLRAGTGLQVELTKSESARRAGDVPRVLVADARTPGIEPVLSALDVQAAADGSFSFFDRSYAAPTDAIVATLVDPARPGLPLTVYLGVDAARAVEFVRDLAPCWRPAVRCYRDGLIEREGRWNEQGAIVWSESRAKLERLAQAPVETLREHGFDLVVHGPRSAQLEGYRARLVRVRERLLADLAPPPERAETRVTVHVWAHAEDLALATGAWALSTNGPLDDCVHVILSPHDDGGFAAARAWAAAFAGAPAQAWMLDGVAVHAAGSWWGRHLGADWLPYLASAELAPPPQLLTEPAPRISPHVLVPWRGALFGWLFERRGREGALALWRGESELELPSDADLRAWIERDSAGSSAPPRFDAASDDVFRRGLHLVPPVDADGRGFRGYGTRACEASLRAARELGANALALAPVVYLDGGFPEWAGERDECVLATSTPDVALAATCSAARGLHLMFAPQLLTTRSAGWAGWTLANSESEWSRFFAELERSLVHYALLAELCDADLLCLGTELALSTRVEFADDDLERTPEFMRHNGERWRQVIASVRRCFRGALTYAANGQGEPKQVDFWPALDFVGVNLFRSLAADSAPPTRPDDAQATARLRGALQSVADVARSCGKRGLVTEIGFPPTRDAWLAPDRALGEIDLAEQSRLFACLAEAARRQAASGAPLGGIYVWCWSTDPDAGRVADRSFTLQNRPAAQAVARMFGR